MAAISSETDNTSIAASVAPPSEADFDETSNDLPIIAAVYSLAQDNTKPTILPKSAGSSTDASRDNGTSLNGTVPSKNGLSNGNASIQGVASIKNNFQVVQSTTIQCAKAQTPSNSKPEVVTTTAPAPVVLSPTTPLSPQEQSTAKNYTPIMPKPPTTQAPANQPKILVPVKFPPGSLPTSGSNGVMMLNNQPVLYQLPNGQFVQLAQPTTTPQPPTTKPVTVVAPPTQTLTADPLQQKRAAVVSTLPTKGRPRGVRNQPKPHLDKISDPTKVSASVRIVQLDVKGDTSNPTSPLPPEIPPPGSVENPVAYINSVFSKKKMALKVPIESKDSSSEQKMTSQESTASQVMNNLNAHEQRIQKLKELLKQQEANLEKIRSKRKLEPESILDKLDDEPSKRPRTEPKTQDIPAKRTVTTAPTTPTVIGRTATNRQISTVGSAQPGPQTVMQRVILPANTVLGPPQSKMVSVGTLQGITIRPLSFVSPPKPTLTPPGVRTVVTRTAVPAPASTLKPVPHKQLSIKPANLKLPLKPKASQIKLAITPKKTPTKVEDNQTGKFFPNSADDSFLRLLGLERVVDRLKPMH